MYGRKYGGDTYVICWSNPIQFLVREGEFREGDVFLGGEERDLTFIYNHFKLYLTNDK